MRPSEELQDEQNIRISIAWNSDALRLISPDGTLTNPSPAPLSVAQVERVMNALAGCPHYKRQTIVCFAQDGTEVKMTDGSIVRQGV